MSHDGGQRFWRYFALKAIEYNKDPRFAKLAYIEKNILRKCENSCRSCRLNPENGIVRCVKCNVIIGCGFIWCKTIECPECGVINGIRFFFYRMWRVSIWTVIYVFMIIYVVSIILRDIKNRA
jgi:hypothetical protein